MSSHCPGVAFQGSPSWRLVEGAEGRRARGEGKSAKTPFPQSKKVLKLQGPRGRDRSRGERLLPGCPPPDTHILRRECVSPLPPFLPLISSSPYALSHARPQARPLLCSQIPRSKVASLVPGDRPISREQADRQGGGPGAQRSNSRL